MDLAFIVDVSFAGFSKLSTQIIRRKLHYTHDNKENFKMSEFSIEEAEKEITNITQLAPFFPSKCSVGH